MSGWLQRVISGLTTKQLAIAAGVLCVIDVLIPDPLPVVDELLLGVLTVILARWPRADDAE